MVKRMQEQKGEERIVAKSEPTTMNLAFADSTSFSTLQKPIASKSPGILKAPCQNDWTSTGEPEARAQRRVLKDGKKMQFSGCRYEETRRDSKRL